MMRLTAPLLIATLTLAGCGGGFSDSGWNPMGWFGPEDAPATLEPDEGYGGGNADPRPGMPAITGARWEVINEGRLLVVTGATPTKGYWKVALIPQNPSPTGRLRPDADGVLRLRFVGWPPPAGSDAARLPANPQVDGITAAVSLSSNALAGVDQVMISSASNVITIRK